jgi:uncharacterized protein
MEDSIRNIIEAISEIQTDGTIPKNIKEKMGEVIKILETQEEKSIKVDKALHVLDSLSEDSNVQSYTRTQIWNIISALETA